MKTTQLALISTLVLSLAVPARAESVHPSTTSRVAANAEAPQVAPQVRIIRVPRGATAGSSADDQRYAIREAASEQAKNFKGGNAIIISTTAAVIILLGVIIIILLT